MGRQCLYYDSQWLAWEPKPNGLSTLALANGVRWRKRAIKMAIALSAVPSNTWLLCVAARNSYKWTDDKDQMSNVYVCVYWWLVFSMIFSRAQQKNKNKIMTCTPRANPTNDQTTVEYWTDVVLQKKARTKCWVKHWNARDILWIFVAVVVLCGEFSIYHHHQSHSNPAKHV